MRMVGDDREVYEKEMRVKKKEHWTGKKTRKGWGGRVRMHRKQGEERRPRT